MKKKNLLSLLLVFTLISCANEDVKGEWKTHVVTVASTPTHLNTYVTPFNTAMQFNCFLNDKNKEEVNNNLFEQAKSIYEDVVEDVNV